jgi:hypothetical protein
MARMLPLLSSQRYVGIHVCICYVLGRVMADNSHALRKIRMRLRSNGVYSLGDAINQAEVQRDLAPNHNVLVLDDALLTSEDKFGEDCTIKGCACKR